MYLKESKIIVIKIGSSLLIDDKKMIRKKWLLEFSKDIQNLIKQNKKVIIVSSGAIAMGCKKLNLSKKNLKLDKSQAVASIGQIELMNLFSKTFIKSKINISQILLTLEDTEQRRRALNAKRTFDNLFKLGFVPIVNENDSIATSEIKYGDNDRLASRVAQIASADCLVLLSDVNGLYTQNPKIYKNAKLYKEITDIDENMENNSTKSISEHGTGGMKTKIQAAEKAVENGISTFIVNGSCADVFEKLLKGENPGTQFLAKQAANKARKHWLKHTLKSNGKISIDQGAVAAVLDKGASLLPSGIISLTSDFASGDSIEIVDHVSAKVIAKGISQYSARDLERIKGQKSDRITDILGCCPSQVAVHRDDMVIV